MELLSSWPAIFARRVAIYGWFSGLLAEELTDEQFTIYGRGGAEDWLAQFEAIGLKKTASRLKRAIANWEKEAFEAIDLRADFASLFLLDKQVAAIPYASFYLEEKGQLYGEMEARMRYFLSQNQLEIHTRFKEPADHISVYLALLSAWSQEKVGNAEIKKVVKEQSDFLNEALCPWLPLFAEKCQSTPCENDFYPALVALLDAFVVSDRDYLSQLLDEG